MIRTILHVDMDAFFAAVEQRDRPELRGKPVIVGSDPKNGKGRGIVATCSYEARKFGVHSAQPISQAWRLCPQGIYLQSSMEKYVRVSDRVMEILSAFSDLLEQVSIDEAFLDVSGSRRLCGTGEEIARDIKRRIYQELQLTASVGVAANKFTAKVASDLKKPDGLVLVEPGKEREFLNPLPIGRLWGVGAKTEAALNAQGIQFIGQLAALDPAKLEERFGKGGRDLWRLARGIDDRPVSPEEGFKSIGHETTFEKDVLDKQVLHDTLLQLTEKVAHRLRANGVMAQTISVKYRIADFTTLTRRITLDEAIDTFERIWPVARKLLQSLVRPGIRVRLIGVYASNLHQERRGQLCLFDQDGSKERLLAAAMDKITGRFGNNALKRATLVDRKQKSRS